MAGIQVTREGPVATCVIDSPETQNALSPALLTAVVDALEQIDAGDEIRCIVLAGSDAAFAIGDNLHADGQSVPDPAAAEAWDRLGRIEVPIVAAVSGWVLGGGFELALACDLIVASKTARLGFPDISLGVTPSGGATQRLTGTVGRQIASEMILTGRRLDAVEARDYGLINSVVDKRVWVEKATRIAEGIASQPPVAIRLAKQAILTAEREGLAAGVARERELFAESLATEDRIEAVEALLQKRPPEFKGR